jgi:tripartite-type tricarboxylate transporter receptor subunit TctC
MSRSRILVALLATSLSLLSTSVWAQQPGDYPARTVTINAPFTAGGALDIAARALATALQERLKQPVVVLNQTGASGNIGAAAVARAAPDGYTLLMTPDTSITANPVLYGSRLGFDPQKDLRPVATVMSFGQILVIDPAVPARSLAEFVDYARKNRVNFGSAGVALPGHLAMEQLSLLTGAEMTHIPYKGMAQVVGDMLGGQIQAGFLAVPGVIQQVKAGKLVALAVSGTKRSPLAPDVPTMAEAGFANAALEFFYVLYAPKGTPDAIVDHLGREVRTALQGTALKDFMRQVDFSPLMDSPAQAEARIAAQSARLGRLIREKNIRLE